MAEFSLLLDLFSPILQFTCSEFSFEWAEDSNFDNNLKNIS